jgi:Domain of unknown function (DUF4271)
MTPKFTWDMSAFFKQDTYFCERMTKFSFLLLSCLLTFGHLLAQTDTSRPASTQTVQANTQDSNSRLAPRRDSSVRHFSRRDSLRRDSIVRHRAAVRRDSLALLSVKPMVDSVGVSSLQVAAPAVPDARTSYPGVDALTLWNKVLSINPFFNFLGKPVAETFEVHHPNSRDSLFYLVVGILFYFALIRIFFEKYFNNLMTLFFRVSLRQQQIREQVLQAPLPSLLLNILFVISGGLFACYLLHYSRFGADISFWLLYLNSMIGLIAIYLVKFLVLKFGGWVFSISRATDTYIFIVFLVNKMLGIFLLPFLIMITFSGDQARQVFITISLAMVFVLWMYRVLAAYRPVRNEIKLTPFHFFLYLCAFEIAPLLLIYKVLLTYLEKVY